MTDWQAISVFVTIFVAWSIFLLGAIKLLIDRALRAGEQRFQALEKAVDREAEKRRDVERELRQLLANLPLQYVQRDDWIRLATAFDAKMDALARKLDEVKERLHA